MQLAKCFVVLAVLIARICETATKIEVKKPDGSAELEEAAVKILTTCYANHDKTVVLMGDHPGSFIARLSNHRKFALILVHDRMRVETATRFSRDRKYDKITHKVHVVVATVSHYRRMRKLVISYLNTVYYDFTSSLLVLGWSSQNKHAICDGRARTLRFISNFHPYFILNLKIMCLNRKKQIMIYNSNSFTNQIPEPWKWTGFARATGGGLNFRLLEQLYREHMGMCKNLDFDKTRDLGRAPITLIVAVDDKGRSNDVNKRKKDKTVLRRWSSITKKKILHPIATFLRYVNATETVVHERVTVGNSRQSKHYFGFHVRTTLLKTAGMSAGLPYAYPFRTECSFLVTQFRGNKSQLQKIFGVIDIYSWVGMYMVYLITLIFFKYFLRQSVMEGILNLVRLTSNVGLIILPPNVAPRIYLSCLLFFVVTMQGIFLGNLAALLTRDIPVQQVDSLQDLIDFGYTIYVENVFLVQFDHPALRDRVVTLLIDEDCMPIAQRDPLAACIAVGDGLVNHALTFDLYVSPICFTSEYLTVYLPFYWTLEKTYNKLMARIIAADILMSFDAMVDEKRMIEYQSHEDEPEPRVMTLTDLAFAFTILGIGLSIAFVTFAAEMIYYRFKNRVRTTRVIVLN